MRKQFLISLTTLASLTSGIALAATCTKNGIEIPCEELKWALWLILPMGIIALAVFVFWAWMLVHAIIKPIANKPLWIIVLLIGNLIGAIAYYFAVKRAMKMPQSTVNNESSNQNLQS
ncbi:MAG: PLDc N-terminal domain-containing protein [bacterium]|nr:PLDc N-terminal domain-containing protein [bacterium]